VHAFHGRWEGYGAGEKADALRENDAEGVISEYLNEGSTHQVCMGDPRVKQLVEGSYTGVDMFDGLQAVVFAALQLDAFPRFSESAEGAELARRPALTEPSRGAEA